MADENLTNMPEPENLNKETAKPKSRQAPDLETFKDAAEKANSVTELGMLLGYKVNNGLFKIMIDLSLKHNVPLPVYDHTKNLRSRSFRIKDEEFFALGVNHAGNSLKSRLLKKGRTDECSICKLSPTWLNKPITIQVDHINGDKFDSRMENLRFLCGNCHSQTETFRAKNKVDGKGTASYCACGRRKYKLNENCVHCTTPEERYVPEPRKYYKFVEGEVIITNDESDPLVKLCVCKNPKLALSKRCGKCKNQHRRETGVALTPVEEQEKLIKRLLEVSFGAAGKEIGISDTALRKRLKVWGFDAAKVGKARTKARRGIEINIEDLRIGENDE